MISLKETEPLKPSNKTYTDEHHEINLHIQKAKKINMQSLREKRHSLQPKEANKFRDTHIRITI